MEKNAMAVPEQQFLLDPFSNSLFHAAFCEGELSTKNQVNFATESPELQMPLEDVFDIHEGKTRMNTIVRQYMRLISSMFTMAVQWKYLTDNPADRVGLPKMDSAEQIVLTLEEAQTMLHRHHGVAAHGNAAGGGRPCFPALPLCGHHAMVPQNAPAV